MLHMVVWPGCIAVRLRFSRPCPWPVQVAGMGTAEVRKQAGRMHDPASQDSITNRLAAQAFNIDSMHRTTDAASSMVAKS